VPTACPSSAGLLEQPARSSVVPGACSLGGGLCVSSAWMR
jgi:hypothetical protein